MAYQSRCRSHGRQIIRTRLLEYRPAAVNTQRLLCEWHVKHVETVPAAQSAEAERGAG